MFPRRTHTKPQDAEPESARAQAEPAGGATRHDAQAKKGRPTPKRSEAERDRKARAKVPANPREARRAASDQRRADAARMREALRTGDEKNMPVRDRGPVRRFVRDHVDSRRGLGQFFLPIALVVLALGLTPSVAAKNISVLMWPAMMILILLDSAVLLAGLRRRLRARFPDENTRGVTMYALARSLQIRRLRAPAPKVKPGQKI